MDTAAGRAGDRLIKSFALFRIVSNPTLHVLAGIGAAKKERRHVFNFWDQPYRKSQEETIPGVLLAVVARTHR